MVSHIALFVPDLPAAERFYRPLFTMQLLMREAQLNDGLWYTLPPDKDWSAAQAAGIEIGMVALQSDAFVLALFQGDPAPRATVLEIGLTMRVVAISALRDNLPEAVELVSHECGHLMFRDPFGYLWHLWPKGEAFRSNGQSSGRWLQL
jgi:catechol 2,3-dioxygenase-like lactoylglutathione lyase family enzyme